MLYWLTNQLAKCLLSLPKITIEASEDTLIAPSYHDPSPNFLFKCSEALIPGFIYLLNITFFSLFLLSCLLEHHSRLKKLVKILLSFFQLKSGNAVNNTTSSSMVGWALCMHRQWHLYKHSSHSATIRRKYS